MALQPHPTKTPITDQQTGLIARVWDAWFRDLYRYVVSLAVDTITAHLADTTGAHAATAISFTPTGTIAATDAQAAIAEAASESVAGIAAEASTRSAADTALTSALGAHTSNTSNPHATTADQVLPTQTGNSGKFLKTNGTASSWALAGGSGGVNFLGLDSTWAIATQDDRDFETSIGNWVAYADAAATSPVDMTGGSPGTTMTRVTVSQLNGVGSGKMDLGSGSSRQGEGISCVGYVPTGYRGQNVAFTGQYSITGANVDGDLKIFGYDVTNSELITPTSYGKILGTAGQFYAIFPTKTSTAQIRVGVHVARTSTAALSVLLDDLSVSPVIPAIGMNGSDWTDVTVTGSWVSNATYTAKRRLVGDTAQYQVKVAMSGAPTATALTLTLPTGDTIDTTKVVNSAALRSSFDNGMLRDDSASASYKAFAYYNSATVVSVAYESTLDSSFSNVSATAPFIFANLDTVTVNFEVPLVGRSANVQMGESSVYKISSYLANGTRVTAAAPTALGQYRSYLRNASANTFTETNGTPTTTPTVADGVKIYNGQAWNAADTNNEPTKYDIFIGKNKSYRLEWYASAARTGYVSTAPISVSTNEAGYAQNYDPTTGILTIQANRANGSGTSTHVSGIQDVGLQINDIFFDVIVSENPLFVSSQALRSEVLCTQGNGHGSTNTCIRRFVNSTSQGTAITYADSATLGASFTINEDGVYMVAYGDLFNVATGNSGHGVSVGSTQLTSGIGTITAADRIGWVNNQSQNNTLTFSSPMTLRAGQVVRAHDYGNTPAAEAAATTFFRITKVAN